MFKPDEKIVSMMYYHSFDSFDLDYGEIVIFKKYSIFYGENDVNNIVIVCNKRGVTGYFYEDCFISLKQYRKQKLLNIEKD